ncbi:MAG TPA: hypothetical protein VGM91_23300 [Conexibacter sp.]|jgi:hypothetical protein
MELIPLALAIGAAALIEINRARAGVSGGPSEVRKLPTRFRNEALLTEALGETATERDGMLHGVVDRVPMAFAPDADGNYVAYFEAGLPGKQAGDALLTLDTAYGRLVQRDARERVLAAAPQYGMPLEGEHVEEDGTIVLTLQVGA